MIPTFLGTVVIVFALGWGALFAFGGAFFRQHEKENFDLRKHFPYELVSAFAHAEKGALYGQSLSLLAALPVILFGFAGFPFPNLFQGILCMVGFTLTGLALLGLLITDMRYAKLHVFLASAYMALIAFSAASSGLFIWFSPYNIYPVPLAYVAWAIALVEVGLMLNPKLKRWEKLDPVTASDGTVSYVRPAHFALAYSEWAATGLLGLWMLILFLGAIFG